MSNDTAHLNDVERELLAKVPTQLFLNGKWVEASAGARFDVEDPATGLKLASVADATAEDGQTALTAAADTQEAWAVTAPRTRAELLRATFEAVTARADDLESSAAIEPRTSIPRTHVPRLAGSSSYTPVTCHPAARNVLITTLA